MSIDHDPRRILDGVSAQAEALRVLHALRCQIRPWHTLDNVRGMLDAEFGLRANRIGMAPDVISDFADHAEAAFLQTTGIAA